MCKNNHVNWLLRQMVYRSEIFPFLNLQEIHSKTSVPVGTQWAQTDRGEVKEEGSEKKSGRRRASRGKLEVWKEGNNGEKVGNNCFSSQELCANS